MMKTQNVFYALFLFILVACDVQEGKLSNQDYTTESYTYQDESVQDKKQEETDITQEYEIVPTQYVQKVQQNTGKSKIIKTADIRFEVKESEKEE